MPSLIRPITCRAVDKVFSLGVLTFTTYHKQLCAVHYVLAISSNTNAKNLGVLQHPQAPTCMSTVLMSHKVLNNDEYTDIISYTMIICTKDILKFTNKGKGGKKVSQSDKQLKKLECKRFRA